MDHALTIRLDDQLAKALSHEAKQTGLSKGEIARDALETRLKGSGKFSVMERYIGIDHGGPADLSVNKAYRREWKKKRA